MPEANVVDGNGSVSRPGTTAYPCFNSPTRDKATGAHKAHYLRHLIL